MNGLSLVELIFRALNALEKETFKAYCDKGLHNLKRNSLYHVLEYLKLYWSSEQLNSSPSERFNVYIERVYQSKLQRWESSPGETRRVMDGTGEEMKERWCLKKKEVAVYCRNA